MELGVHRALRASRVPCQEQESPTCPPDRPPKILLVQVWTLSSSPIHPSFGFVCLSVFLLLLRELAGEVTSELQVVGKAASIAIQTWVRNNDKTKRERFLIFSRTAGQNVR